MAAPHYDFLVVGAGIFGLSTAWELRRRDFRVAILNPGSIPHELAASTDISKAVRMEYGSDQEYLKMAASCMDLWHQWNDLSSEKLYHQVGFLLLTPQPLESPHQNFEANCLKNLVVNGYKPERLTRGSIASRFPAFNHQYFIDGVYNPVGGYAESGRVISWMCSYIENLGVKVYRGQTVKEILIQQKRAIGVRTAEKERFDAEHVVICAGNFTPYLLPELKPYFKVTGHPVFHIRPSKPHWYSEQNLPVFGADIANSGWYGFPLHPHEQVVKIGRHSQGLPLDPRRDPRMVSEEDLRQLQQFLKLALPGLAGNPVVHTRLCCYTDTLDGHYWIDRHPLIKGLTVGSGGSGHGFKMGPVIGKMIADMAQYGRHNWSHRYGWRELDANTRQTEEARHKPAG